jgi:molybdenum cofactor synthesis domain-containing protein
LRARAEIIAIGSELCYGRIHDTNSFWIADQLTRLGAEVQRITCVPDKMEEICVVFKEALDRQPEFVISTGGLGPTFDDLTIESLSRVTGRKIVVDQQILEFMARRRRTPVKNLPPNLVRMARTVEGSTCLANPVGWAPVTMINCGKTMIVALPGPPGEMKACFNEHVLPVIGRKTRLRSVAKRVLVKMIESRISELTGEVMRSIPAVYMKPLVGEFDRERGMPVEIIVFAVNEEQCNARLRDAIERLRRLVDEKGGALQVL